MKIVIAGNYRQYQNYLRENNLTPQEAKYVSRSEQLFGYSDVEVVKVGEWWLNPCAYDSYLEIIEGEKKRAPDGVINKMRKTLKERNLAIIETIMLELGVSDIEELPAKVIELKQAAEQNVKAYAAIRCPGCGELKVEEKIYCTNCGTDLPRA